MVDLKNLLSKPADDYKPPVPLPAGTYYGKIKSQEFGKSKQKKTDYCQYNMVLTGPGDDINADELADVDLSKKSLRTTFYLTPDSMFRLTDFLKGLGINTDNRSLGECIPEAIGADVILDVSLEYDENDTSKTYNNVQSVKAA